MTYKKKLIEVALPLDAINKASAREKSIRHGHPSTLHLWWARRPLATARAVIFSQMVDDPSGYTETLLSDSSKKRAATRELGKRKSAWEERKTRYEEACSKGDPSVLEPGTEPTLQDCVADIERERLFCIIEDLVLWENTTNETVLKQARDEIWQSWRRACAENADHPRARELFDRYKLPAFHDPFAGGGSLPLEAQRLGLKAYASDLNPVAVLINKAMIEIPPKFAGKPPVNPQFRSLSPGGRGLGEGESPLQPDLIKKEWKSAQGLAEDVRYYGKWMRDEAEKRIGHLYPKIEVTAEMAKERPDLKKYMGQKLTVIAWLWARTVKSPNPAFANVDVPLATTFMLSTKAGKEAYVEPVIENSGYRFTVKMGKPRDAEAAKSGTKLARGANFQCLMSGTPIVGDHIKAEGKAGRMDARLMAMVAEGERGRVYLAPIAEHEAAARTAKPEWQPDVELIGKCRDQLPLYGMDTFAAIFTPRQSAALACLAELVGEACDRISRDALAVFPDDNRPLVEGGSGARAYGEAVAVYLGFCVDKATLTNTTQATWQKDPDRLTQGFGRQAIPMIWDYAEANPLSEAGGGFGITGHAVAKVLERLPYNSDSGVANQEDAGNPSGTIQDLIISTDPPYYDNICYADLSDYFYVWLRRSLRPLFPQLFATVTVPKAEEIVASPYRFVTKGEAESFFLDGMTRAFRKQVEHTHPAFPVTIYYAFKQSESDSESGTASTGWETFLDAVIRAGFGISGTWPMRTELIGNLKKNMSALASSIILVCRPRDASAPSAGRREFVATLKAELPGALAHLQRSNTAPVDLAQAAIGPGMAIYTRYAKVLDAEGKPLSIREALALINQTLDEALAEQEGDFDADSRWALTWFEQSGFAEGEYGVAEQLSKSKNTSVAGMVEAGILSSSHGKVRLLRPDELPSDWDPTTDKRLTAWEGVHQLIRALESGGEPAAAALVAKLGAKAEIARELAYRLYTLCERKKRAAEALSYNGLVQSWPEINRLAQRETAETSVQKDLFDV